MQHAEHITALALELDRFVDVARDAPLDARVPGCPDWDVAALIRHTGRVHRWAGWHVRNVAAERNGDVPIDYPDDAGLVDWLAAGGVELLEVLRASDPDAPMWAWGTDQHARFWSRRQLHETAVHRADVEQALGITPSFPVAVAIDAIDELLDNLPAAVYFSPDVARLVGTGESLHLHATDPDRSGTTGGEWMITLVPEGFRVAHDHGKGDVAVRGAAGDLLLLLYNRLTADDAGFEVFGDRALLDRWLADSALR